MGIKLKSLNTKMVETEHGVAKSDASRKKLEQSVGEREASLSKVELKPLTAEEVIAQLGVVKYDKKLQPSFAKGEVSQIKTKIKSVKTVELSAEQTVSKADSSRNAELSVKKSVVIPELSKRKDELSVRKRKASLIKAKLKTLTAEEVIAQLGAVKVDVPEENVEQSVGASQMKPKVMSLK